jgi:molybdopterin/thiamine biosynthesis adenylyltransferase
VHGLLVIGDETATGICESANERRSIRRVVVAGIPLVTLPSRRPPEASTLDLRDRQLLAIGAAGQAALAASTIAVVGISGGGSHVVQQLVHAGVGTLIAIDSDTVDERNLRRLVGAVRTDIDRTKKIHIPARIARVVRPEVNVIPIDGEFPSTETIGALCLADIIIGCVDGWDVRDALNDFSLQQRVPYIDIGASVAPPTEELAMRVGGQITIVTPDGPCMRCMGLITSGRVAASRARRQGYVDGVDEPQVVSVNGTLASEAVTAALMLVASDSRLERYRRFAYPPGKLTVVEVQRRAECPACREARLPVRFER